MIPKVVANFTTTLADKLTKGATSFSVVSIESKHGNLPDGLYGVTASEGEANEEHMIGTLDAATKTFTALIRDVSVLNGLTSASTGKDHRKGAEVKITDHPALARIIGILNGDELFDPDEFIWEYTDEPAAFTDHMLVTKKWVMDNTIGLNENEVASGNITFNGIITFAQKIIANAGLQSAVPMQSADPVNSNDVATKAYVLSVAFGGSAPALLNSPEVNYNERGQVSSIHDVDNGKTYVLVYEADKETLAGIYDGVNTWAITRWGDGRVRSVSKH